MVIYLRLTKDGKLVISDYEIYNNGVEDLFLGTPNFMFELKDNLSNIYGKDYLIEKFKLKPGQNCKCELREWPKE
jgi:hypothetical protein